MVTGMRLEEVRGLEALAKKDFVTALFTLATAVNNPTAIDPDDAAAVGTAPRFAKEDHQHAITAGAPAGLTLTATSAESAGTGFARDVHVHATDVLPWGEVARQSLTSSSSTFTTDATTDMSIAGVVPNTTRLYKISVKSQWFISAAGSWNVNVHAGGTLVDRLWVISEGASNSGWLSGWCYWEPGAGTVTVDIRVDETSGTGDLTLVGAAGANRQLLIEDIGPR